MHALLVRQGEKSQSLNLVPIFLDTIPTRGQIPSMVGLGQSFKELGGNDMGRVS